MDTHIEQDVLLIDKPNRNNRIYSRATVEKMVADFNERTDEHHPLLGELNTPVSPVDTHNINLARVSHVVEELYIERNWLKAKIKVIDSPMGRILNTLHEHKVSVGFAMRGTGVVSEESHQVDDFNLITVDVTANPATIPRKSISDQIEDIMDGMTTDGFL